MMKSHKKEQPDPRQHQNCSVVAEPKRQRISRILEIFLASKDEESVNRTTRTGSVRYGGNRFSSVSLNQFTVQCTMNNPSSGSIHGGAGKVVTAALAATMARRKQLSQVRCGGEETTTMDNGGGASWHGSGGWGTVLATMVHSWMRIMA
ncbi:DExH-box ATP-dependent RNA helicase DExH6-like isoform X1 [Sesbania bispinosa]|nr:DExH-box ATP-dependent RNA helicase DExH6-like isoform X1 [Sesbania bispinosa]